MPADAAKPEIPDLLAELEWRGLIHQVTDREGLAKHLASGQRRVYAGFDPTADSLTIGNLVPIMLLRHVQRAGHTPVVVMGGGTGLIGDPSGKSAERLLMTSSLIASNIAKQQPIFERVLAAPAHQQPALILNNLSWLGELGFLEVLRKVGKHFSVNQMIQRDSVRERLQNREQGISFTEFSYQVLQAYDYFRLFCDDVTLQVGGSDQWGNIVAGTDLIRRIVHSTCLKAICVGLAARFEEGAVKESAAEAFDVGVQGLTAADEAIRPLLLELLEHVATRLEQVPGKLHQLEEIAAFAANEIDRAGLALAFGLTAPLVTKADGGKFGKTETGAVWLTAERTSPYAYYQFWLNADDRDVERFLKIFTLLKQVEIASLMALHAADPGARHAHRALAQAATTLLHGEVEMHRAETAAKALFSGEVAALDKATLAEAFASAPTTVHEKSELSAVAVAPVASAPGSDGGGGQSSGAGTPGGGAAASAAGKSLVDLLVETGLAKSKREAREFLQNGSIALNGAKVGPDDRLTPERLLHGEVALLRRGKKQWHVTRWE